ncbi:hypothetical protein [Carboxylicivirga linearis]|uniref:Uncharacterized protein n=1 Tax=Carboxylicivirga linearis TaxID=1628157 RepID=A0ABS5K0I0_9BACT|nr:hypothetical protein [Carboxylicivirga linearis]MBS2100680.1 hypothetical protein [Carboxylicivirga linearis]
MTVAKNVHAQFYNLLNKMGIPQSDRRDFLMDYTNGLTDSLSELYSKDPLMYFKMINDMAETVKKRTTDVDKWRKRVMASVGGYLKLMGRESNANLIKKIACRATGYDNFNAIPPSRLMNVYNTFLNKQQDFKQLTKEMQYELASKTLLN